VAFSSGELLLSLKFDPDDLVRVLEKEVQRAAGPCFKLITEAGEVLSAGDRLGAVLEDGGIVLILRGPMTLAGRNLLTRFQRLQRDVERFRTLLEDDALCKRAGRASFNRLKRVDNNMVYKIRANGFLEEIRGRAGLKTLHERQVHSMMLQAMLTCNGALNAHDFHVFYRNAITDMLHELEKELQNEQTGKPGMNPSDECSRERWLRELMSSCCLDGYLIIHLKGRHCALRLWTETSFQLLHVSQQYDTRNTYVLLDGHFEIQGDDLLCTRKRAFTCWEGRACAVRTVPRFQWWELHCQPRRRRAYYKARRAPGPEFEEPTPLTGWRNIPLHGCFDFLDTSRVNDVTVTHRMPIESLVTSQKSTWKSFASPQVLWEHVVSAMHAFEFAHAEAGAQGLLLL